MNNKKTKSSIILACFCTLQLLLSVIYLIFTFFFCKDETNYFSLIIGSIIIFLFVSSFCIGNFIKKNKKILFIFSSLFVCIFIIFNILNVKNIIKLPTDKVLDNLVGKNINDVLLWGEKNNIIINQSLEYSDITAELHIISQDVAVGTPVKNIKELNLVVSNGPNYDKSFILQNLVGLNIDEAMEIINSNFMNNIEVTYEINDEIVKDTIISQNINGEIRRNDLLKLVVSLGKREDLVPVKMINLKNKPLFEAKLWLDRNGISYELSFEFSNELKKDYCLGQSVNEGVMINPNEDKVTLIISKGKEIKIPDFTTMSVKDATNFITENRLKLTFKEAYDLEIPKGNIVSTNFMLGDKVEEGTNIELTISKGPLKMESFESISSFRSWASSLGLNYEENSEFHDSDVGHIISISPNVGENINVAETIKVTYSKGKSTTVPNFYNKSKSEASKLCNSNNLKCYFSYVYSNSINNDYVVKQSMVKDSKVAINTSITIYLSKGKEPVKPTPPVCDKSITETVYLTSGNDGSQTQAIIQKSYPNVKWKFQFVEKCSNGSTASGTICNAQEYDSKKVNHCDTITLTVVK